MKNFKKEQHDLETESDVLVETIESELSDKQIILYNDEFNTFEFVIDALIKVCNHEVLQAEQCTFLVHYKGKCSVKKGTYEELESFCTALLERGLTAEIE